MLPDTPTNPTLASPLAMSVERGAGGEARATWVGTPVRRFEDPHLLTGQGRFVDDIQRRALLHVAFVRSPIAAGCITALELTAARKSAGVEAVFSAADFLGIAPLTARLDRPEFTPTGMPLLAGGRVRYAGEPVALVVARSPHEAEDAADLVTVEYDPERAVTTIDAALATDAPLVHAGEAASNVLLDVHAFDTADIDEALAAAHLLLEATFESGRLNASPLEARVCLAEWDSREARLVVHLSTQVPHLVRLVLADVLGLPENRIRVVSPDVGGGFGQKCVVSREEVLVAAIAQRLGGPVRWTEDRRENLTAGFHGHEQRFDVRAGFAADGRITALDADIVCDVGAYSCYPLTCGIEPLMAAGELPSVYKVPRYRARARAVATNKAPMAPYRGVSRPQIVLAMERLMKKASLALGIPEIEVRRRNLILHADFPYRGINNITYDPGSYLESLERCAGILDAGGWPARQREARAAGRLLGLGFACFSERSAYGTEVFAARKMAITPGYENAHVRMDGSGTVIVNVSTHSHGQGHRTSFAQIAADQLGLDPAQILVRFGDTDEAPPGWGTYASRSLGIAGSAVKLASIKVADRLRTIAAHLLEASPADLELTNGRVGVRGSPESSIGIDELARIAHQHSHRLPADGDRTLEATATYDPPGTFSNATHGAEIEIDPGTGAVRILRYVAVEDCGVVVNPMIVDGQVRGGIAQGIAAALYERIAYDAEGQPLTSSFQDYVMPTAAEIPDIEIHHLETPSAFTATGAKGMGEGGTIGAPATIANAVSDALAHLGAGFDAIPITPEDVLRALRGSTW